MRRVFILIVPVCLADIQCDSVKSLYQASGLFSELASGCCNNPGGTIADSSLPCQDLMQKAATISTITSFGGSYQASQENAFTEPYMAMHPDVRFEWWFAYPPNVLMSAELEKLMYPKLDVMDNFPQYAIPFYAADNLLQLNLDDFPDGIYPNGTTISAQNDFFGTLLYGPNKELVGIPDIQWAYNYVVQPGLKNVDGRDFDARDWFDFSKYPGKRVVVVGFTEYLVGLAMSAVLLEEGRTEQDCYDDTIGIKSATGRAKVIAKLAEFFKAENLPNIVVEATVNTMPPLVNVAPLGDGSAIMGFDYSGRNVANELPKVWSGATLLTQQMTISNRVKGNVAAYIDNLNADYPYTFPVESRESKYFNLTGVNTLPNERARKNAYEWVKYATGTEKLFKQVDPRGGVYTFPPHHAQAGQIIENWVPYTPARRTSLAHLEKLFKDDKTLSDKYSRFYPFSNQDKTCPTNTAWWLSSIDVAPFMKELDEIFTKAELGNLKWAGFLPTNTSNYNFIEK